MFMAQTDRIFITVAAPSATAERREYSAVSTDCKIPSTLLAGLVDNPDTAPVKHPVLSRDRSEIRTAKTYTQAL